jgi:ribonuclease HII
MNNKLVVGLDEVGRGCLVGAVVAAAVILDPEKSIDGLADSKKLSEKKREKLAIEIRERSLAWAIGRAEPSEIDEINILHASMLAMQRAYAGLGVEAGWAMVDGNRYPELPIAGETVVKGDQKIAEISAASIIAKVARDDEMKILDAMLPGYGISGHKGYPTRMHVEQLDLLGIPGYYRHTFSPVKLRAGK